MKPTASPPVPVWLVYEHIARDAYRLFDDPRPVVRAAARSRFHAAFRRLP
jgi:hypothetical protein